VLCASNRERDRAIETRVFRANKAKDFAASFGQRSFEGSLRAVCKKGGSLGGGFVFVLGVLCFFLKEEEDGDGVVC
jgi:hypothetical protein